MNLYEKLLGISVGEAPPDFFQLLGIGRDEQDPEAIKAAAVSQTRKLQKHLKGPHAEASEKLIARVKKAYQVTATPDLRAKYLKHLEAAGESGSDQKRVRPSNPKTGVGQAANKTTSTTRSQPEMATQSGQATKSDLATESGGNRSVLVAAIAIGGIGLVAIIAVLAYVMFKKPDNNTVADASVADAVAMLESSLETDSNLSDSPTTGNDSTGDLPSNDNSLPLDNSMQSGDIGVAVSADQSFTMPQAASQSASQAAAADAMSQPPSFVQSTIAPSSPTSAAPAVAAVSGVPINQTTGVAGNAGTLELTKRAGQMEPIPFSSATEQANNGDQTPVQGSNLDLPNVADVNAHEARTVLQKHCFRCHGENETDEGGFGFVLNREKLISSGYVRPQDSEQSLLLDRMVSQETPMPPEGEEPRPSAQEIGIIQAWILAGAEPFEESKQMPFLSNDEKYRLIAADLAAVEQRDRPFARYFTIDHLANAGYSQEELGVYQMALAKLINSLSWNRKLAALATVGPAQSIFRVDLRDLKWTPASWTTILQSYPYGVLHDSPEAASVRAQTNCEVPVLRADWFVATASRPPLYHTLAQIPETDQQLEKLLRVDVRQNIEQVRLIRLGFARSGVSQHNRLIERHESIFGAYWKSYDFAGSTGRKNIFENPLGPGTTAGTFAHDGGEIIFQLPNGMLAYMLTDHAGNRIDKGPTSIVSDPRQPDRAVVNGVSCMSCHYGGFIQKSDEILNHVQANQTAYLLHEDITALYANSDKAEKAIESDTKRYMTALGSKEIQIPRPTRAGEPIVLVANRYQNEIDIRLAAAECGLPLDSFTAKIDNIPTADLSRKVGVWKTRGGVVKRQTFQQVFTSLMRELDLGKIALIDAPAPAAKPPGAADAADVRRLVNLPFGRNPVAADAALAAALRAAESRDWKKSEPLFEQAIRTAVNLRYRIRACEHAIPMFERLERVELLVDAHKIILDGCTNSAEIQKAKTNLFLSLLRFNQKSKGWAKPPTIQGILNNSDWGKDFPSSVSNALATTFERQLAETPDHEPTLRVLQTYYHRIHDLPEKRRVGLLRLKELYQKRGEVFDVDSDLDLATLLAANGDNQQAAEIFSTIGSRFRGLRASAMFLSEAKSWIAVKELDKAVLALNKSVKQCLSDQQTTTGFQLDQIGDAYASIDQTKDAVESYKLALRFEKNPTQFQAIQKKLADLVSVTRPAVAPMEEEETVDALLDPKRKFRLEAQNLEARTSSHPSSIFSTMTAAAEAWINAEDSDRATKALKKAAIALRRLTGPSQSRNHEQLAVLFRRNGQNQDAMEHYLQALKGSTYETDIDKYQIEIIALKEEDAALAVPAEFSEMLDPKYKYRVQARQAESQTSYSVENKATNFMRACEFWIKAGDKDQVQRCGTIAETAIGQIVSDSPYPPQEHHYAKLAKIYLEAELHEPSIECFVAAMSFASRDDQAVKYHQEAKGIAQRQGLSLPELDAKAAVKLDPLNRHRVQAAKDEQDAAKQTGSGEMYRLMSAIKNWRKADEKTEATRVANQYARLLLADKSISGFDRKCEDLGEIFAELERVDAAKKCYEEAIQATKYDSRKTSIQKKIDSL